jgi:hypothetical protein
MLTGAQNDIWMGSESTPSRLSTETAYFRGGQGRVWYGMIWERSDHEVELDGLWYGIGFGAKRPLRGVDSERQRR